MIIIIISNDFFYFFNTSYHDIQKHRTFFQ